MTLTAAQEAQLCQTCVEEAKTDHRRAPGRYCARFCCRCGHPPCPAYQSYEPRREPEPLPENVIAMTSRATRPPAPSAWDERDQPTWIDNL